MAIAYVYDALAKTASGRLMHFNVVIDQPCQSTAIACGLAWLNGLGHEQAVLAAENCFFCHSLEVVSAGMRHQMNAQGYAIYPMEGCPR